ncbi:hypothetical protein H4R34_002385 [Dimargaris verticillata]|uniref:Uncharacterized protein n=1 Tax=Dimargaris verticillata TaxID=2761393 RepID=A0A9W8EE50_9FUNG|nr:hypothetical protein H4R34_002385 [Dimargaris verticillata]
MPLFRIVLASVSLGTLWSNCYAVPMYGTFQPQNGNVQAYPQYVSPNDLELFQGNSPKQQAPHAATHNGPDATYSHGNGVQGNLTPLPSECSGTDQNLAWMNGQTGCWPLGQSNELFDDTSGFPGSWQTSDTDPYLQQYLQAYPGLFPESAHNGQVPLDYNAAGFIPGQSGQAPLDHNAAGLTPGQYQYDANLMNSAVSALGSREPQTWVTLPQGDIFPLTLSFQPRKDKANYLNSRVGQICQSSAERPIFYDAVHKSKTYVFETFFKDASRQLLELIQYAESGHSTFRLGPQKPAYHITVQELLQGLENRKTVMLFYWDNRSADFKGSFPYKVNESGAILDCEELWKYLMTPHLVSSYVMFDGPAHPDDIKSAGSILFRTLGPLSQRFAAALNVVN